MLIPSSFQRLPSVQGCQNGAVIMGGTVGQMAAALAQLSNAKFLGECHYNVNHSLFGRYGYNQGTGGNNTPKPLASYKGRKYYFLYQSTALSERLALMINYNAITLDDTPNIKVKLRPSTGNAYNATPIDNGIEFINDIHIESDLTGAERVQTLFTGCELIDAPTNTGFDDPRPLYVPTTNRGELLILEIEITAVCLIGVHLYDIFESSVSP